MPVNLIVNGVPREVASHPDTALAFALRTDRKMSGTKLGCGLEQCGSCLVLIDGEPSYSCATPVGNHEGRQIETIEGLAEDGVLHPLQQVFLESNAAQCGFCSAGIIMRAKALLDSNPSPSRAEIAEALDPHLCRCGAHPRVIRAVLQAARTLSERAP